MIEARIGRARAVWTDRHGGVSPPPYDTANLSLSTDDDPASVRENRRRLASRLGLPPPDEWWWLRQVHGAAVVVAHGLPPGDPPEADAAVTTAATLPMVVLTADCAPVALACDDAAGVVHAGWTGTLAGVVEAAVARLRTIGSGEVTAAIGPCIRPACYEFGADDLARITARLGSEVAAQTDDGRPALDLPRAVTVALERAGVREISDVGVCTASSPDHYSHRRDGATGRQALIVVLEP